MRHPAHQNPGAAESRRRDGKVRGRHERSGENSLNDRRLPIAGEAQTQI
jgi:hypothetical protein